MLNNINFNINKLKMQNTIQDRHYHKTLTTKIDKNDIVIYKQFTSCNTLDKILMKSK